MMLLAARLLWTQRVEHALGKGSGQAALDGCAAMGTAALAALSACTAGIGSQPLLRKKLEQLITELVQQQDCTRALQAAAVTSTEDFCWQRQLRAYQDDLPAGATVRIAMADVSAAYGYEYLGVSERLVQTALTGRVFLSLLQALHWRFGGSPFGPAGTGKTETVKALGSELARFVLVFNCDESFDFDAMGRIFVGLCRVGAWGCFDEFNRLEERIMSALSQQILAIQTALRARVDTVQLLGQPVGLRDDTAIFITMNPTYAGRSQLPDNLRGLFRSVAMVLPDRETIAQVMLYSKGFGDAERLAKKVVLLFDSCAAQLSPQTHYDFGLRALKAVLLLAGQLRRGGGATMPFPKTASPPQLLPPPHLEQPPKSDGQAPQSDASQVLSTLSGTDETTLLLRSVTRTVVPKLVAPDVPAFRAALADVFAVESEPAMADEALVEALCRGCTARGLHAAPAWIEKVVQLHAIAELHHGLILVGATGCGKSTAWRALLAALSALDGVPSESHVIDPKVLAKEDLIGRLDTTTREWRDGVFTAILRRVAETKEASAAAAGELGGPESGGGLRRHSRHWIVFDGDVDPEWVEAFNSLLDDNRVLTLPNGERIRLPDEVRIVFEVADLRHATLATVSRCGMVYFDDGPFEVSAILSAYLAHLRHTSLLDPQLLASPRFHLSPETSANVERARAAGAEVGALQLEFVGALEPLFAPSGLVTQALATALALSGHVMPPDPHQAITATLSLLSGGLRAVLESGGSGSGANCVARHVLFAVLWGCGGALPHAGRFELAVELCALRPESAPPSGSLLDWHISPHDGEWSSWAQRVPPTELPPHRVSTADVVVPTVDTVRHEHIVQSWIREGQPLLLCGPPGEKTS